MDPKKDAKKLGKPHRTAIFKEEDDNKVGLLYCTYLYIFSKKYSPERHVLTLSVWKLRHISLVGLQLSDVPANASTLVLQNVGHMETWAWRESDPLQLGKFNICDPKMTHLGWLCMY